MRKVVIPGVVLAVLLGAGAWWVVHRVQTTVRHTAAAVTSGVEAWAGTQVVRILNDLIRPELTVESFRYEPPSRITLNGVTLVDEGVEVVKAASFVVELREVPKHGSPVVIESVRLEQPVVRLIPRSAGGLLGFTDMVDMKNGQTYDDGGSSRPSDVFAIKRIEIEDGTISYERASKPAMVLDEIDMSSTYDPADDQPGVYHVDTVLGRPPLTSLTIAGDLDLDASWLRVDESKFELDVDPDEYAVFPPSFQEFLRATELRASLTLAMTGMLPFTKETPIDLTFDGDLRDAFVTLGSYQLPMKHVLAKLHLGRDRLTVNQLEISAFRGTASVNGELALNERKDATVQIRASDLRIEDALRTASNESPKFAGDLSGSLDVNAALSSMPESVNGAGEITITQGKLWNDPVIHSFVDEFEVTPDDTQREDHGMCRLYLLGDLMQLRDVECVSGGVGARGEGEILYDGTLNLRVNAGPLERMQNDMGAVGDVLGAVTDSLLKYHVTGPWRAPVLDVRPLGIGADESKSGIP